jgi:hypothetical protein
MFRDDFLMRQIKRVMELIASASVGRSGERPDEALSRLDEAEDELFAARGLDRRLVAQLGPLSAIKLLGPVEGRLLVRIIAARSRLEIMRGGDGEALRRRALALLEAATVQAGPKAEDDSIRASLEPPATT